MLSFVQRALKILIHLILTSTTQSTIIILFIQVGNPRHRSYTNGKAGLRLRWPDTSKPRQETSLGGEGIQENVPLWLSRILQCHCSSLGHYSGTGSMPGPGTSKCRGPRQKKKREKQLKKSAMLRILERSGRNLRADVYTCCRTSFLIQIYMIKRNGKITGVLCPNQGKSFKQMIRSL